MVKNDHETLNEVAIKCESGSGGAIGGAELSHDVRHMTVDGVSAENKVDGYLVIGAAGSDEAKDLDLALA